MNIQDVFREFEKISEKIPEIAKQVNKNNLKKAIRPPNNDKLYSSAGWVIDGWSSDMGWGS